MPILGGGGACAPSAGEQALLGTCICVLPVWWTYHHHEILWVCFLKLHLGPTVGVSPETH